MSSSNWSRRRARTRGLRARSRGRGQGKSRGGARAGGTGCGGGGGAGEALRASRLRGAEQFGKQVAALLRELMMDKARFEVAVAPLEAAAAHGIDAVEFLLAANPGLPPAPLRRIGSGGELSRVMLAL